MALRARNASPGLTCQFSRLWTPRVRATDLDQGPHLRRGVRAGSLRASEPRTRDKTRGRKKDADVQNRTDLHIEIFMLLK